MAQPAVKITFGSCDFDRTSPPLEALTSETAVLNIAITFEEALKLNLAVQECVRKLNSYKRSTVDGKRSALNVAIHLGKNKVSINETRI